MGKAFTNYFPLTDHPWVKKFGKVYTPMKGLDSGGQAIFAECSAWRTKSSTTLLRR